MVAPAYYVGRGFYSINYKSMKNQAEFQEIIDRAEALYEKYYEDAEKLFIEGVRLVLEENPKYISYQDIMGAFFFNMRGGRDVSLTDDDEPGTEEIRDLYQALNIDCFGIKITRKKVTG